MNPLQIVARTPKNNCGECGYPTCLAFAASVVSTGTDPEKCPYIDLEGLTIETSGVELENAAKERDLALVEHLKSKIADIDLNVLAPRIGAEYLPENDGSLHFSYLGQDIVLSGRAILLNGKVPEDPRDQILLYNYVYSQGGTLPSGAWIGMESMPNSISKVRTLATYCEKPLAELMTGLSQDLVTDKAAEAGGYPFDGDTATLAIEFKVLPMIPQRILFWEEEPEDGFEAKVKILFDQNVLEFLDIESLLFSAERLAERLRNLILPEENS